MGELGVESRERSNRGGTLKPESRGMDGAEWMDMYSDSVIIAQ